MKAAEGFIVITAGVLVVAIAAAFATGCVDQATYIDDRGEPWREIPVCPTEAPRLRQVVPSTQQTSEESSEPMMKLQERIEKIVDESEGDYGIYVESLKDGVDGSVAVESDRSLFAASLYKVPLVLYIYEQALSGDIDLTEELIYTQDHYASGAGILKDEEPGSSYGVRYLASLTIIDSDNIAARMLLDFVARDELQQYQKRHGADNVNMYDNRTSPRDMGIILRRLVLLMRDNPDHYSDIALWMKDAYPRDRIPAGVPDESEVASKTGTWPETETYNDAAVVYVEGSPAFSLVVMSENVPSYVEGMTTIAQIAEETYSHMQKLLED